jgi:O-antigen/teichoic acid export membrane protein
MTHTPVTGAPPRHAAAPAEDLTADDAGIRGVARGGLANLIGAAFAGLSGFIVAWIVTHALGTDQAGAFFASTAAFVLIGTVAKLGTQTSLVYFPARLRAIGNVAALRRCLRAAFLPVTVASLVIGVAMWVFASEIADVAARNGQAEYAHQLRILAFFLPASALSDALLAGTRGWRAMRPTVMLDRILRPTLQVGLLAIMLSVDFETSAAFVIAWAAPYFLSAALAWRSLVDLLRNSESGDDSPGRLDRPAAGRHATGDVVAVTTTGFSTAAFWRFTWPRAFASVAQLALQRVDVVLLASIAGLKAAAIYAVAGRFIVLGQFANQGISQAVQPRLAERLATDDHRNANALYQIATTWLIVAAWPIYLLVAVFASTYLRVFGNGYAAGRSVVIVLAFAMALGSGCGMVDMVLAMAGRTSWNLMNVSAALICQMIIDIMLIPHLGPLGAAIGLGTAILINNVVPLSQIALTMGIHPFGRASMSASLLAVGCFGLLPLGVAATFGTGLTGACVALVGSTSLYLVGLFRLRRVLQLDTFLQLRRTAPIR